MKIDAKVTFNSTEKTHGLYSTTVPVDIDYVSGDHTQIYDWVANELEKAFGVSFYDDEFKIENVEDIIAEIDYDEFLDKTQVY